MCIRTYITCMYAFVFIHQNTSIMGFMYVCVYCLYIILENTSILTQIQITFNTIFVIEHVHTYIHAYTPAHTHMLSMKQTEDDINLQMCTADIYYQANATCVNFLRKSYNNWYHLHEFGQIQSTLCIICAANLSTPNLRKTSGKLLSNEKTLQKNGNGFKQHFI